jgi:hypothetical protein
LILEISRRPAIVAKGGSLAEQLTIRERQCKMRRPDGRSGVAAGVGLAAGDGVAVGVAVAIGLPVGIGGGC